MTAGRHVRSSRSRRSRRSGRPSRAQVEQRLVTGAELRGDALQIVAHIIQDAHEALLVLHLAIDLLQHLMGIINRRDGLVATRVTHARPRIGAILDANAEFERAEASAGELLTLEKVF